jgi:hypothetical protein
MGFILILTYLQEEIILSREIKPKKLEKIKAFNKFLSK